MKQICLVAVILFLSLIGFAQTNNLNSTDTILKTVTIPEERIGKLEAEIATLKANQIEIQRQLTALQSEKLPANKKKKLVVNRAGSKQVNWADDKQ